MPRGSSPGAQSDMPSEVILPKVDMDMATGSIASWHVAEGEEVIKGQPLFDIETDKAAMEVESPASGRLHHVSVKVGSEVPIGTTLAWIYSEDEDVGPPPDHATPAAAGDDVASSNAGMSRTALVDQSIQVSEPRRDSSSAKQRATPAARNLAAQSDLNLADVSGSGPRARVQRADVERLLEVPEPDALAGPALPWSAQTGNLSVLSSGSGEAAPWVLIHGFAADASGWSVVEKRLRRSAAVHRIELPNHGRSPRRKVADFRDLVSQMRQAFDELGDQPARLVGHSLGAAVSLALADTRPRRIESLTLISPAGLGPEINGVVLAGIARASRPESLGPWLKQLTGDPDVVTPNYVQAAARQRPDGEGRAAQASMMDALFPDGVQAFDLHAALGRLECPTRIIWGRRDAIVPWKHALRAPGQVALHLFDDVGHLPHVEIPEQVCALMTL